VGSETKCRKAPAVKGKEKGKGEYIARSTKRRDEKVGNEVQIHPKISAVAHYRNQKGADPLQTTKKEKKRHETQELSAQPDRLAKRGLG